MNLRKCRSVVLAVAALIAVSLLALSSCGGGDAPLAGPAESESAQARLERGEYLVEGVAHCYFCHSEVDWQSPDVQPVAGRKGSGTIFPEENLPFQLIAPNISPDPETGIGSWTDEELDRAIREGIGRDGRRLFPMMPNFSMLSDDDLAAVIVYLRSVPAVRNELPKTEMPEPIRATLPPPNQVARPVSGPEPGNTVARGAYLAQVAECADCHTPMTPQGPVFEMAFGGGMLLTGPWGAVVSPNITSDASGISYYDEATFRKAMREGAIGARKLNHIMPYGYFRRMSDEDLDAVFAFLKTVKPVQHGVDNTEPPTPCKLCGRSHGLGKS